MYRTQATSILRVAPPHRCAPHSRNHSAHSPDRGTSIGRPHFADSSKPAAVPPEPNAHWPPLASSSAVRVRNVFVSRKCAPLARASGDPGSPHGSWHQAISIRRVRRIPRHSARADPRFDTLMLLCSPIRISYQYHGVRIFPPSSRKMYTFDSVVSSTVTLEI